ncbi:hypothetical protein X777_13748 [Ooceraea biroi]|uniref:Uncharacterized protein n=1 Tax=Ooceraea biroi TaxID=2015173 RepID=A0A026VZZ4_OOCBI|nr:hypothetical protein X777_13748 [Ooceraea biroi]
MNLPILTRFVQIYSTNDKLFVKYTIMPLMQKLLNAFPSGLLKLRLGLRDESNIQTKTKKIQLFN